MTMLTAQIRATTREAAAKACQNPAPAPSVFTAVRVGSTRSNTTEAVPKLTRDRDEAPRSPPEATRRRPTRAAITMAPPIPNTATSTSEFTPTIVPPHPASSDPGRAGPSMLHERAVDLEGRTGSGKGSGALDVLHPGTGGALDHAKTGRHTLTQIRHMADHAHRTATVTQPVQDLQDLLQGVLVQGAEPLVHEECVDVGAARLRPGHIAQPQSQRQRTEEGLPTREGGGIPFGPGPGIHHSHPQTSRRTCPAVPGGLVHGVTHLVPAVGHAEQPVVGGGHHLFQTRSQYIRGQAHVVGV